MTETTFDVKTQAQSIQKGNNSHDRMLRVVRAFPEEYISQLTSISASMRLDRWTIGQITSIMADWVREGEGRVLLVDVMDVYDAVAHVMQNEISPRTARLYCSVYRFYPESVKDKYSNVLPFQRFVDAMVYGDEKSIQVLDYCVDYADRNGTSPKTSLIHEHFRDPYAGTQDDDYNPVVYPEDVIMIGGDDNEELEQDVVRYHISTIGGIMQDIQNNMYELDTLQMLPDKARDEVKGEFEALLTSVEGLLVFLDSHSS